MICPFGTRTENSKVKKACEILLVIQEMEGNMLLGIVRVSKVSHKIGAFITELTGVKKENGTKYFLNGAVHVHFAG